VLLTVANAPTGAALDPAELLDVDVHELTRSRPLIPLRLLEPDPAEPSQPCTLQDRRDGRQRHRKRLGDLSNIDVKKLGRIEGGAGWRVRDRKKHYNPTYTDPAGNRRRSVGWEYVHVAIDDYSRLAYVEVLEDEKAATAIGFLKRALAFFARFGIRVERILTDNGSAYRATVHALACKTLGIRHIRTRAYRPQTNGKAERFIRTLLNGWAYGAIYGSSHERSRALDGWLWHYNHRRRHSALGHQPPVTRTNVLGSYI
jgi:transposase InsO family protein